MTQEGEYSPLAGASRERCGSRLRDGVTGSTIRAQCMIAAHLVRPEWAAMMMAVALGGGGHG
ncbi:hypothetical protein [Sphingomonas sanxanigenens]|uniref:Uncharacterized protein n=1 Tax=Sphingomonas sanxanigenens DSM 19645 = NX02 TaxID=1123269 RepID=W0ALV6_9SPHN|nr:hypothetical protein [Sphingomonas sanxanigenens]AHE57323.1 hypothetical protein NX02_28730 [Sphingomonas sanxanigenens DSM 19645 = NX02]